MDELLIKNATQIKTWTKWYKEGETHGFHQPVGKQYSYGKGPDFDSEIEELRYKNKVLEQQVMVLKKYKELERKWYNKPW